MGVTKPLQLKADFFRSITSLGETVCPPCTAVGTVKNLVKQRFKFGRFVLTGVH